jgi:hypothetical protein
MRYGMQSIMYLFPDASEGTFLRTYHIGRQCIPTLGIERKNDYSIKYLGNYTKWQEKKM